MSGPDGEPAPAMEELATSECLALLRRVDIGRLAVRSDDGGVDVFPVNFVVDHGTVVFRTAPGTKLDLIASCPLVAFEADHFDWYEQLAWSVVVKGTAEIVSRRDDLDALFRVEVHPWHPSHKPRHVRVVPTSITGRRFPVQRQR